MSVHYNTMGSLYFAHFSLTVVSLKFSSCTNLPICCLYDHMIMFKSMYYILIRV